MFQLNMQMRAPVSGWGKCLAGKNGLLFHDSAYNYKQKHHKSHRMK